MLDERAKKAAEVLEQREISRDWLKANFYSEWEEAFKHYKAEADPQKDSDGKDDPGQDSIGLPDTWAYVRRTVARITAQIPNFKHRSKDQALGDMISRSIMYQWDRAGMQRLQKRHVLQAVICGWSVRPWYWAVEEHVSSKRVNILDPELDPFLLDQVVRTYGDWLQMKGIQPEMLALEADPETAMAIRAALLAKFGRGGLLPVKYLYRSYEGPKADFLFVGDCFPEPDFQSINSSQWFICDRRRNIHWLRDLVKLYPEMAQGVDELIERHPKGTERYNSDDDADNLRRRLEAVIRRTSDYEGSKERSLLWTIVERHIPGPNPKLAYVAEGNIFLGEVDYPYDLGGKLPFTECVLIDDLLCGVGDSVPRVIRGLQKLHERQVSARTGLVYNILRPLIGTTSRELIENPGLIKRHGGFRLVHMRGPGEIWQQGEQAAMAAAAVGLNDESGYMRHYQMATGETNMSMMANVDPQQGRTATGAKLMQGNQDILTKDLNDMFAISSLSADGEMMRLLNRSELADAIEFDAKPYRRIYAPQEDAWKQEWIRVEPLHFQHDIEIVAEVGSTIADDDETRVARATNLFQAAMSAPQLFNLEKARDEFLIAHGKAGELEQWRPQPSPPPPPEVRTSLSVAAKWLELSEPVQEEVLKKAGLTIQDGRDMGELEGEPLSDIPPEVLLREVSQQMKPQPAPKPNGAFPA